ncbi:MAG TPA: phage minor head protein [Verrucomicrobiae bacterium]|nr:phage minor head protein [Verrucomicrobiae bacterium]
MELELEEPEFDDDSPRYDLLGKSAGIALTDDERRALIGKEPLPNGLGLVVRLPATIVETLTVPPSADQQTTSATATVLGRSGLEVSGGSANGNSEALLAAGETSDAKASLRVKPLHASLTRYRAHAQTTYTPLLKHSVFDVLAAQRHDIAARLRKHAEHVKQHPSDTSIWFDKGWDAKLRNALAPRLEAVAHVVNAQIHDVLPAAKAAPVGAVERVMARGAARVQGINETTRAKVQEAISRGLEEGLSVTEVADLIEEAGTVGGLDMGSLFDELRAETIARTELMDAYNATAIGSYGDAGVTQVQAIDGDGDEECAARDGQVFDIEEADSIEDHPNGTLDWVPVLSEVP